MHYKGRTEQDAYFHFPPCWEEPRNEPYEGDHDVKSVTCIDCFKKLSIQGHPDLDFRLGDETRLFEVKMQFEDNFLSWFSLRPGETPCIFVIAKTA
jgi:hypothetical protein